MRNSDARRAIVDQYKAEMAAATTDEDRARARAADTERRAALLAAEQAHTHQPGCKCGD